MVAGHADPFRFLTRPMIMRAMCDTEEQFAVLLEVLAADPGAGKAWTNARGLTLGTSNIETAAQPRSGRVPVMKTRLMPVIVCEAIAVTCYYHPLLIQGKCRKVMASTGDRHGRTAR